MKKFGDSSFAHPDDSLLYGENKDPFEEKEVPLDLEMKDEDEEDTN